MNDNFFSDYNFDETQLIQIISSIEMKMDILLDTAENSKGFNFLHAAAYYGLDVLLLEILKLTQGQGLNSVDKLGRTPIHHLASNGRSLVLNAIFEKYPSTINLEQINAKGRTALHSAAKHLHDKTVKLLISKGANPNALDIQGHTPLSLAYHRHYPGQDISFSHPVIHYLLDNTRYWESRIPPISGIEDAEQSIKLAWRMGMQYAVDRHWIPGMLGIQHVYFTALSQFVVLKPTHLEEPILLCLDRTPALQKAVSLTKHVTADCLESIRVIADKVRALNNVHIWGIELAGIDAQLLALHLQDRFSVKQLVLINSPGLPSNLSAATMRSSTQCCYFFASEDTLHLQGTYLWSQENPQVFFYTTESIAVASTSTQSILRWALKGLRQQISLHREPTLTSTTSYRPGKSYLAQVTEPIDAIDHPAYIERLFNNTDLAIQTVQEQYQDNSAVLREFARYEYCAHGLAYMHSHDGQALVKWWESEPLLPLHRLIHHQGLYCYLLQHEQEWIVQFQGTDFSDFYSASRDLDHGSAGVKRIRQQYSSIIERLARKLQEVSFSIKLVICGHSLGGGDAQNFFAAVLATLASLDPINRSTGNAVLQKFMAREKENLWELASEHALKKIKSIHLFAYNGAGIRHSTAELAKAAAHQLQSEGIVITVNHQRVQHDIVNTVGETTLHDFHPGVTVRSLFFDGRETFVERVKTSHTDRQFFCNSIGKHGLFQGAEGAIQLKMKIEAPGGKLEPRLVIFNQCKTILQKGCVSERLTKGV